MNSTQYSLLARLQAGPKDTESWARFITIYAPLLEEWVRRMQIPEQDRQDVVQETFVKLLTRIGSFQRSPSGSFRAWLYTVLKNCWLDKVRSGHPKGVLDSQLADPRAADPQEMFEQQEYQNYLLRRVFSLVIADFPPVSQAAFRRYVMEGLPAVEVSREFGISTNALYLLRGRVLRRLKEELVGLADW